MTNQEVFLKMLKELRDAFDQLYWKTKWVTANTTFREEILIYAWKSGLLTEAEVHEIISIVFEDEPLLYKIVTNQYKEINGLYVEQKNK